eukprot:CAMPEP_0113455244 /NCGR_PEP_ID=MMETSP0014_2-20120614/8275_1 /TAXON_ID=2857 /ORGANISM="Nitzschia sp." /LENGTH=96 /DNA_ID=CAMNT_0000346667 /DNA_START=31 /DNA_END=318 /DNA_ORIENTATION=+ /assembly_acc=CAM_ASM_000159
MGEEFKKIDQMLPHKKGQSPLQRSKDIEGAMDWMRNRGVSPAVDADTPFDSLPSIPISKRSPEERQQDVDHITEWLRNGKPPSMDTPTDEFKAIDQ